MPKATVMRAMLAGAVLAMAGTASATTQTVTTTLDLTLAGFAASGFTYAQDLPAFTAVAPFTLAVGDTLDYTIDFLGSQQLTLLNPGLIWGYIYSDISSDVAGTGTLSLLDTTGNVLFTSDVKSDVEGVAHFGQQFGPGDFTGGLPTTLTFGGLHYVGTVDAYQEPGVTERTYQVPALALAADRISQDGTVPEPASWAMLTIGFAAIGASLRRRVAVA